MFTWLSKYASLCRRKDDTQTEHEDGINKSFRSKNKSTIELVVINYMSILNYL